ncbi:LLM class flavin-dependent oxidoreductase [Brucellaceae bacterium C25G]
MNSNQIRFGVMLQGAGGHMNAWKHPSGPADASVNLQFIIDTARKAEEAGISFAFIADGLYINEISIPHFLNRFEPLTVLSTLAAHTKRIGLAGTVSSSYSDPFTIARQFASLDQISCGRAGWNVVTTPLEGSGRNYGKPHPDHALRYEIADEYLDVTKGLWDSWDDDAFIRDRETGQFYKPEGFHRLDHKGRFFSVEGPLNIQRSPQGQPVIFQAGASEAGIGLAGKHADAVFTNAGTIKDSQTFYAQIKASAVAHGRSQDDIGIFPGIGPIVGRMEAEAEEKYQAIRNLVSVNEALAYLGRFFDHHDFTTYDLDAQFPELGDIGKNSFRSTTDRIKRDAAEQKLTLREVALNAATPRTSFIGTAEQIADEIIRWKEQKAADGFILGFQVIAEGLDDFTAHVLPILEERGYYEGTLKHDTLRENLGLVLPQSRYAAPAQEGDQKGAA